MIPAHLLDPTPHHRHLLVPEQHSSITSKGARPAKQCKAFPCLYLALSLSCFRPIALHPSGSRHAQACHDPSASAALRVIPPSFSPSGMLSDHTLMHSCLSSLICSRRSPRRLTHNTRTPSAISSTPPFASNHALAASALPAGTTYTGFMDPARSVS